MHPELFRIGSFALPTYGFAMAMAFLLALLLLRRRAPAHGVSADDASDLGIWLLLSGLLGAKLLLVVVEGPGAYLTSWKGLLSLFRAGGVFYGGLLGALVVGGWFMWKRKLAFLDVADAAAPAVALGQAIGRVGCLSAGCCWGRSCSEPWAITFTNPAAAANVGVPLDVPLHPTQIYEGVGLFVLTAALLLLPRRKFRGTTFGIYLVSAALLRGTVEFFRGDPRGTVFGTSISTSQFIAALLLVVGVGILATARRRPV